jgi:hypothetical protein
MKEENTKYYRLPVDHWHIVRATYLIGGIFTLISVILALLLDQRWLYFTLFVSAMLINFSLTGYCPMAFFLDKLGMRRE